MSGHKKKGQKNKEAIKYSCIERAKNLYAGNSVEKLCFTVLFLHELGLLVRSCINKFVESRDAPWTSWVEGKQGY